MKLGFAQFTCEADAEACAESVESARRMARRHGLELVERVEMDPGDGSRGVHLNGIRAVEEELRLYRWFLKQGVEWVLKMDTDTLWVSASWLDRLRGPWAMIGGEDVVHPVNGASYRYIRGHAYLIRPRALRHLPQEGEALEALLRGVNHFCSDHPEREKGAMAWPEDEAIGGILRYALGEEAVLGLKLEDAQTPFVGFWNYDKFGMGEGMARAEVRERAALVDFVEFGRMGNFQTDVTDRAERKRKITAPTMAWFLESLGEEQTRETGS